jgi:PAS domain S-box-containing protein
LYEKESRPREAGRHQSPAGDEFQLSHASKMVRRSLLVKHAMFFFAVVVPVTSLIGWAAYNSALDVYQQRVQVNLDADEAYAPIARLRTKLLLIEAMVLIGGVVVSVFIARRMTRPILELADTAITLAAGDLGARVAVRSRDEIGILGSAFNRMAGELQCSYALLEQRVHERTADLAQANAELEREIADRKQAEQSRAEANARLQSVLNAATQVSIIATDLDGLITVFNSGAEQMLGYTAEEMIGKQTPQLIHLASEIVERGRQLSSEVGRPVEGFDVFVVLALEHGFERREWTYVRKDGGHLTVSLVVTAVRDCAGLVIGFLGVAEDVTDRKLAEQALHEAIERAEAANQAKSAFLANMSHEIRTPMNAIIGMTDLVLDTQITPEQREFLSCVSESADTLLAVVNDILDFSKIEAGKLVFEPTVFNLRDCVGDTIRSLGIRAHEKDLELAYHVQSGVPELVVGDRIRLRQILLNLVGNAIKFTEVGEVVVEVDGTFPSAAEAELQFTVKDTGIGIPKDKQSAVFGVFEQADNTTTRRYGGTGLGLAISSRLVEMMGGRLTLQSEEGFGSTFTFTVRVGRVDEKTQDIRSIRTTHLSGVRALVVDDNATNRRILQETLRNWSMDVVTASDASQALLAMRQAGESGRPFRLVLTDCHMPGEDGFALAQAIKCDELLNTSVIMMLTSGDHPDDSSRCRQMGIAAHLLKPVRQTELFNAISLALGQSEPPARTSEQTVRRSTDDSRSLKILLAEDSLVNQKLAVALLRKRGHDVAIACNGIQAVEQVVSGDFDLVLMDVQMPDMDGLEATIAIRTHQRQNGSYIPIIALTAHAMKGDRERCLQAGMDAYVSKPVRPDQLFETIESLVGASAGASQMPSPSFLS